jgi:hypothetical protein
MAIVPARVAWAHAVLGKAATAITKPPSPLECVWVETHTYWYGHRSGVSKLWALRKQWHFDYETAFWDMSGLLTTRQAGQQKRALGTVAESDVNETPNKSANIPHSYHRLVRPADGIYNTKPCGPLSA